MSGSHSDRPERDKPFVARMTGEVRIDRRPPGVTGRSPGTLAQFKPGARTAWHTNPLGQTLVVKAGHGRMQCWGQPIRELRSGDVVSIAAGEKHWLGAAPDSGVSVFAIQPALDGVTATWMEDVSDAEYLGET